MGPQCSVQEGRHVGRQEERTHVGAQLDPTAGAGRGRGEVGGLKYLDTLDVRIKEHLNLFFAVDRWSSG